MALATEQDNNKIYTFKQMLQQEDKADFVEATMKEVSDHKSKRHWEVVPRSEKPANIKSILAIWAFKRKRCPAGRISSETLIYLIPPKILLLFFLLWSNVNGGS